MIVAIEGLTNAGKSTFAARLAAHLRDARPPISVTLLADAIQKDGTSQALKRITSPPSEVVQLDRVTELLLYAAHLARKAQLTLESIDRSPETVVLIDRWASSVLSFFTAVRDLPRDTVHQVVSLATQSLLPDLTVFIDIDLATAITRAETSPFSRKDEGIIEYWDRLHAVQLVEVRSFTRDFVVLPSGTELPVSLDRVAAMIRAARYGD